MMYRLERSAKPVVNAKFVGSDHVPKRTWNVFAVYPMPVHPSAVSSTNNMAQNMLIGRKGEQVRLLQDEQVIAVYEWAQVMENPGDPECSNTVWGWKVVQQASAVIPERNHATSAGAYIPSVGVDSVTVMPSQSSDYLNATPAPRAEAQG